MINSLKANLISKIFSVKHILKEQHYFSVKFQNVYEIPTSRPPPYCGHVTSLELCLYTLRYILKGIRYILYSSK